jgi:hypothetical protein
MDLPRLARRPGVQIARRYGSQSRYFPGLNHWDLARNRQVRGAIADYLLGS